MIFILAVLLYGATPDLNEEIILKKYRTMGDCLEDKDYAYTELITQFPDAHFDVVCYRSITETA